MGRRKIDGVFVYKSLERKLLQPMIKALGGKMLQTIPRKAFPTVLFVGSDKDYADPNGKRKNASLFNTDLLYEACLGRRWNFTAHRIQAGP